MIVEIRYSVFAEVDIPEAELLEAENLPNFTKRAEAFEDLVNNANPKISEFMDRFDHELCAVYGASDGYLYYEI